MFWRERSVPQDATKLPKKKIKKISRRTIIPSSSQGRSAGSRSVLYNRKTSGHVIVGLKINHMSRRDDGCWGRGWMTLSSNTCQVSVLSAGTWNLHYSLPLPLLGERCVGEVGTDSGNKIKKKLIK